MTRYVVNVNPPQKDVDCSGAPSPGGSIPKPHTVIHVWESARVEDPEWSCLPAAGGEAACGHERERQFVLDFRNVYGSVTEYLRDPMGCHECGEALIDRHGLPGRRIPDEHVQRTADRAIEGLSESALEKMKDMEPPGFSAPSLGAVPDTEPTTLSDVSVTVDREAIEALDTSDLITPSPSPSPALSPSSSVAPGINLHSGSGRVVGVIPGVRDEDWPVVELPPGAGPSDVLGVVREVLHRLRDDGHYPASGGSDIRVVAPDWAVDEVRNGARMGVAEPMGSGGPVHVDGVMLWAQPEADTAPVHGDPPGVAGVAKDADTWCLDCAVMKDWVDFEPEPKRSDVSLITRDEPWDRRPHCSNCHRALDVPVRPDAPGDFYAGP